MTFVCSAIEWHVQPGRALGPNHTTCKPMALLFGSSGILQPKWLLKCCVALLASTWIADLNYVGKSCLSPPFMRKKQRLEEGHLQVERVCFSIAAFLRQSNVSGKQDANQSWWHFSSRSDTRSPLLTDEPRCMAKENWDITIKTSEFIKTSL